MLRKVLPCLGITFLLLVLDATAAESEIPPAEQWFAEDAVVVLEIAQPRAVLEAALNPEIVAAVTSLPAYQHLMEQKGFQDFTQLVHFLEYRLGADWKTALGKLTGGGMTLALGPGDQFLAAIDAEDPKMLKELHEVAVTGARQEAQNQGQPDRVKSADYRGVTCWSLNEQEVHTIIGNRLLLANKADVLRTALDRRADSERARLTEQAVYQAAKKACANDRPARLFINLEVLKQHPPFAKALAGYENPLAALLFAGAAETVKGSSWAVLALDLKDGKLSLEAVTDKSDSDGAAAFVQPAKGQGVLPQLHIPRQIAGLSLYRDLEGFYQSKEQLFPERTSGLVFFENMMGIFFTGRDFTGEVLAQIEPQWRLVVAEQRYEPSIGAPKIQVPAFAAIFQLKEPKRFGPILEEAWQKALGLINFTRGQQALPGLVLDRPEHAGVKFTTSRFPKPEAEGKGEDIRFNFSPSLALLGDYAVLSSAESLTRDVIDALKAEGAEAAQAMAGTDSLMTIDGKGTARMLKANRENLVLQNMVKEGNPRAQAEEAIDTLVRIIGWFGELNLAVGGDEAGGKGMLDVTIDPAGE